MVLGKLGTRPKTQTLFPAYVAYYGCGTRYDTGVYRLDDQLKRGRDKEFLRRTSLPSAHRWTTPLRPGPWVRSGNRGP
jgi:hypothetical protein